MGYRKAGNNPITTRGIPSERKENYDTQTTIAKTLESRHREKHQSERLHMVFLLLLREKSSVRSEEREATDA